MTIPSIGFKKTLKTMYNKLPTDHVEFMTTTGSSQAVDLGFYQTVFTTTTNSDDVSVPDGTIVGERKLLTLGTLDTGGDVITVSPTNIDTTSLVLDAADEYALLEWGVTAGAAEWTIVYHNATVT